MLRRSPSAAAFLLWTAVIFTGANYCLPRAASSSLGEYRSPCKRHSPEFDECLKTTLNSLIPKLSKYGLQEAGLPQLDPLEVPELSFTYTKLKDLSGSLWIANSTALGLSKLTVHNMRSEMGVDEGGLRMELDLHLPELKMSGDLRLSGRFGIFPLVGGGPYNLTTGEVKARLELAGRAQVKNGTQYLQLERFRLKPAVADFNVHTDDILRRGPQMNKMMVTLTKRFWEQLYERSQVELEASLERMGREALNRIFFQIPFDSLFPSGGTKATQPTKRPPPTKRTKPSTVRTTTKRRVFAFLTG